MRKKKLNLGGKDSPERKTAKADFKKHFPNKKYLTMLALVLALGLAVYLNWRFEQKDLVDASAAAQNEQSEQSENYGDALFVSGSASDYAAEYFSEARLTRKTSREEALSTLQDALKGTDLTDEEKGELTSKLTAVAQNISKEATIESLIKSKGFSDCVVYLEDGGARVAVASGENGLTEQQVSQIMEIVVAEGEVPASGVSIIEVK